MLTWRSLVSPSHTVSMSLAAGSFASVVAPIHGTQPLWIAQLVRGRQDGLSQARHNLFRECCDSGVADHGGTMSKKSSVEMPSVSFNFQANRPLELPLPVRLTMSRGPPLPAGSSFSKLVLARVNMSYACRSSTTARPSRQRNNSSQIGTLPR